MSKQVLTCPSCSSEDVAVQEASLFMANTGQFYCHSFKTHDSNTRATCLDCGWEGQRHMLRAIEAKRQRKATSKGGEA